MKRVFLCFVIVKFQNNFNLFSTIEQTISLATLAKHYICITNTTYRTNWVVDLRSLALSTPHYSSKGTHALIPPFATTHQAQPPAPTQHTYRATTSQSNPLTNPINELSVKRQRKKNLFLQIS